MSELDKFIDGLGRTIDKARQAQLRFAVCKSVDRDERTMTAEGVSDGVDYIDVRLGFGYADIKPAAGSVCLIGILEGREALAFLINAETVELVAVSSGKIEFNGGENGGLVKSEAVAEKIAALEKEINGLKNILSSWTPVPQDGGAALKAAVTAWAGQAVSPVSKKNDFENSKITH